MIESHPLLVADIGGTNLRFALVEQGRIGESVSYPWPDPPCIATAAREFLKNCKNKPRRAAFSCASAHPWLQEISMVNVGGKAWGYTFRVQELREALELDSLYMMNDFTAVALSIPLLEEKDLFRLTEAPAREHAPIGVLGAGTGLGCSGLVWDGQRYIPISGEGGHVTLAGTNARERQVIEWLHGRFEHVSAERVLSGPGLVNLYDALSALEGKPTGELSPAAVLQAGIDASDPLCQETLEMFCSLLGSVAGNLALTLGAAGGIYIGGGIAPRMAPFLFSSEFRSSFCAKGRYRAYLEAVPVSIIMHPHPGLLGAYAAL